MSDTFSPSGLPLSRRELLQAAVGAGVATQLGAVAASAADKPSNRIVEENLKEGSLDWQLTRVRPTAGGGFRASDIEGYCSKQSVQVGESIEILVSTDPPRPFRIEIFRTGYYGGRGARLMTTLGPFTGQTQPVPEPGEKSLHECRWEATTSLKILEARRSGWVRLEGCPVSVAELVLLLSELGGIQNPYFEPSQVLSFNRAYLAWRAATTMKRMRGEPYQIAGETHRGDARPEVTPPSAAEE